MNRISDAVAQAAAFASALLEGFGLYRPDETERARRDYYRGLEIHAAKERAA